MRRKQGMLFTSRTGKMGIALDDQNRIVRLSGPASESDLRIGDKILSIAGVPLGDSLFPDEQLVGPVQELCIRRMPGV